MSSFCVRMVIEHCCSLGWWSYFSLTSSMAEELLLQCNFTLLSWFCYAPIYFTQQCNFFNYSKILWVKALLVENYSDFRYCVVLLRCCLNIVCQSWRFLWDDMTHCFLLLVRLNVLVFHKIWKDKHFHTYLELTRLAWNFSCWAGRSKDRAGWK